MMFTSHKGSTFPKEKRDSKGRKSQLEKIEQSIFQGHSPHPNCIEKILLPPLPPSPGVKKSFTYILVVFPRSENAAVIFTKKSTIFTNTKQEKEGISKKTKSKTFHQT